MAGPPAKHMTAQEGIFWPEAWNTRGDRLVSRFFPRRWKSSHIPVAGHWWAGVGGRRSEVGGRRLDGGGWWSDGEPQPSDDEGQSAEWGDWAEAGNADEREQVQGAGESDDPREKKPAGYGHATGGSAGEDPESEGMDEVVKHGRFP